MSFIVVDVEADGEIPGRNSMVCFAKGNAEALLEFQKLGLKIELV